jgi:hypothetical protein
MLAAFHETFFGWPGFFSSAPAIVATNISAAKAPTEMPFVRTR